MKTYHAKISSMHTVALPIRIKTQYVRKRNLLGWICYVNLDWGLSASAQIPDKPALTWASSPGILYIS